jgi:N-acetyl sugar amidotransferase
MSELLGRYGLPLEVKYCKKCTINNQRPSASIAYKNTKDEVKRAISFGKDGICEACKWAEIKKDINWDDRKGELRNLCDKYRRTDGRYDVLVPGSGGKDSVRAAHELKYNYGMNPLLVTWPPQLMTEMGRRNMESWLDAGFSCYTVTPNQKLHKLLSRLSFENLCHPFQPFTLGQNHTPMYLSTLLDIPLVMYGENGAEYGENIKKNEKPTHDESYYSSDASLDEVFLGGVSAREIIGKYGFTLADLKPYLPVNPYDLRKTGTKMHFLGYYLRWHPQEEYYYSVENTDFLPNDTRTEGSYSKYSSIDDKFDWLNLYTTYIKFGIGRATYDSAQEVRNGDITREEGIALIKRFDGEYPAQYLQDCCDYMGITIERFNEVIEEFRTPHLWIKDNDGKWKLKNSIWKDIN